MVSFEGFRADGREPIYLQIIGYIKRGIVAGEVSDGDELPSRRVLSALLGVNPNTVQKACRQLEEEGILVSHAGAKSFIVCSAQKREELRRELAAEGAADAVLRLKHMGLTLDEAVGLIRWAWEEDENG